MASDVEKLLDEAMIERGCAAISPPVMLGEATYRAVVVAVLRAALTQPAASGEVAQPDVPVDIRMWDCQWVNVVNAPDVLSAESLDDAVAIAVRMTEEAMRKNYEAGNWPPSRKHAAIDSAIKGEK